MTRLNPPVNISPLLDRYNVESIQATVYRDERPVVVEPIMVTPVKPQQPKTIVVAPVTVNNVNGMTGNPADFQVGIVQDKAFVVSPNGGGIVTTKITKDAAAEGKSEKDVSDGFTKDFVAVMEEMRK